MILVCVDRSRDPLAQRRVRAVVSRYGTKITNNTFTCPGFTGEYIETEIDTLISEGWVVQLEMTRFDVRGRKKTHIVKKELKFLSESADK